MRESQRTAFQVTSLEVGDDHQRKPHIQAECRCCGAVESVLISNRAGSVPHSVGERMFRRRGWKMGANRHKDECPSCLTSARVASASPDKRAAIIGRHIAEDIARSFTPENEPDLEKEVIMSLEKPKRPDIRDTLKHLTPEQRTENARKGGHARWAKAREREAATSKRATEQKPAAVEASSPVEQPTNVVPMRAEPPRQPTLADNRRIRDALDELYDEGAGHYRGAANDKAVAEKLNVPTAWVANVRENFYGPERSEASERASAEIAAIWKKMEETTQQINEVSEKFVNDIARLESVQAEFRTELVTACVKLGINVPKSA